MKEATKKKMVTHIVDINPLVQDYYLEQKVVFQIPKSSKPLRKIVEGGVGKYKKFTHMCDDHNRPLSKYLHNRRYSIEYRDDMGLSFHTAENHTQIYDKRGFLIKDTKKTKKGIYVSEYEYDSQGTCIYRYSLNGATNTEDKILVESKYDPHVSTIKIFRNDEEISVIMMEPESGKCKAKYNGMEIKFDMLNTAYFGFMELSSCVSVQGIDFEHLIRIVTHLECELLVVDNKFRDGEIYFQIIGRGQYITTNEIDDFIEGPKKVKTIKKTSYIVDGPGDVLINRKRITYRSWENSGGSETEWVVLMDNDIETQINSIYDKDGDKIYERYNDKETFYVYKED